MVPRRRLALAARSCLGAWGGLALAATLLVAARLPVAALLVAATLVSCSGDGMAPGGAGGVSASPDSGASLGGSAPDKSQTAARSGDEAGNDDSGGGSSSDPRGWLPGVCHPRDESVALAEAVNDYRQQNGKSRVPLSTTMFAVAHLHARDLADNQPYNPESYTPCNPHSWSDQSSAYGFTWTPVCYPADPDHNQGMWNKPKEISGGAYQALGIENVAMSTQRNPDWVALWASSPGHDETMLNTGFAKNYEWQAVGAAVLDGHAVLWFGPDLDSEPLELCD